TRELRAGVRRGGDRPVEVDHPRHRQPRARRRGLRPPGGRGVGRGARHRGPRPVRLGGGRFLRRGPPRVRAGHHRARRRVLRGGRPGCRARDRGEYRRAAGCRARRQSRGRLYRPPGPLVPVAGGRTGRLPAGRLEVALVILRMLWPVWALLLVLGPMVVLCGWAWWRARRTQDGTTV